MVDPSTAVRPILTYGDPLLRQVCRPVAPDAEDLGRLAEALWRTLLDDGGVGLAAPQLGDLRRVVIARDPRRAIPARRLVLVNPRIVAVSPQRGSFREGCLSFPDLFFHLDRPAAVTVSYEDLRRQPVELEASGLLARIILHEVDHLDGILFIDHLSPWRRLFWHRRLRRLEATGRKDRA